MKPLADDDRRLLIRQSYPFKTRGEQPCESKRKKYALAEVSRVITSEGTVVKNMVDDSVEVCIIQLICWCAKCNHRKCMFHVNTVMKQTRKDKFNNKSDAKIVCR